MWKDENNVQNFRVNLFLRGSEIKEKIGNMYKTRDDWRRPLQVSNAQIFSLFLIHAHFLSVI